MTALTARQYWEHVRDHALTPKLAEALYFLQEALTTMPDRKIKVGVTGGPSHVMYTDASTLTKGGLRLGLLLLEEGKQGLCSVYDVPQWVVDAWELRTTYIGQGELLAGPLAMLLHEQAMKGRYVTWYVDNTSAVSALIKTCSPTADNSPMALVSGLMAARAQMRIWYEWVPTHQNESDGLSRDGYDDPYVQHQLATGAWGSVQPVVDWNEVVGHNLLHTLKLVRRWGSEAETE